MLILKIRLTLISIHFTAFFVFVFTRNLTFQIIIL